MELGLGATGPELQTGILALVVGHYNHSPHARKAVGLKHRHYITPIDNIPDIPVGHWLG